MTSTSAIIINWNTKEHLLRCVESFLAEGLEEPAIHVVDQGSTDGSLDAIARKFHNVHRLVIHENIGYAHAVNRGVAEIKTPFIVIANADIVAGKGSIQQLAEVIQGDEKIGMIGCAVLDSRGNKATRFTRTSVARAILLEVIPRALRGVWRDAEQLSRNEVEPFPVTFVEGAFLVVRREAFDVIGGMDEGFTFFYEDADLPMRMIKSGYRVLHIPGVSVTHHGGASFSQVPGRHASEFHRNMVRLYSRHALRRGIWLKRFLRALSWAKIFLLSPLQFAGWEGAKERIERNKTIRQSLGDVPRIEGNENPLVSVIIPTYNRKNLVLGLVENLRLQTYSNFETIVVDQSDGREALIVPAGDKVRWVRLVRANRSLAKNIGLREAKGEILLFCDDDIVPDNTMIETHVQAHSDLSVGGVSCRVTEEGLPGLSTENICRVTPYGRVIDRFQSNTECFVETLVGGNMSVKRAVMKEAGYFEAMFIGTSIFEEPDLSERLRNLGFKILFTNKSSVHHLPQKDGNVGTRSTNPAQYYRDFHHNELVFFLKNRNHFLLLFVVPFCLLRTVKQSWRFRLSFRQGIHMFAGVFSGIRKYYWSMK